MKLIWTILLCCSSLLLIITLVKQKIGFRWLGTVIAHLLIATIILYVLNILPVFEEFRIPINLATIATISVLGIPGLALLFALQWMIF